MATQKTLLLALAALAAPSAVSAQGFRVDVGGDSRTLTVSGEGIVAAPPDRALVTLGVETEGQEPRETLERHEEQVARVLTAVRRLGVTDRQIQIQSLTLDQRYEHRPDGRAERSGYVARRMVTVTLDDPARVPDLVATVVDEGANQLAGLAYVVADPDRYEDQALEAAYGRAREKAERLARASGTSLGRVLAVQEQGVRPPFPLPMMRMEAMDAAAANPGAYSTGEQEVRATVIVTYELED